MIERIVDTRICEIELSKDEAGLAEEAANLFITIAAEAVKKNGRFATALSGGKTPAGFYSLLAAEPFSSRVPWNAVHLFWADERCVPPYHIESNYRLASEALITKVPIPMSNIHRMEGEIDPNEAALKYAVELEEFFGGPWPKFDVVWLGLGEDGHTASLFPGSRALRVTDRSVTANYIKKLDEHRITLTAESINRASRVVFLVSGGRKAKALKRILNSNNEPCEYPATMISPAGGRALWLIDHSAAAGLKL